MCREWQHLFQSRLHVEVICEELRLAPIPAIFCCFTGFSLCLKEQLAILVRLIRQSMALMNQLANVERYRKELKVHQRSLPKCERSLVEAQVAVFSAVPHVSTPDAARVRVVCENGHPSNQGRIFASCTQSNQAIKIKSSICQVHKPTQCFLALMPDLRSGRLHTRQRWSGHSPRKVSIFSGARRRLCGRNGALKWSVCSERLLMSRCEQPFGGMKV